MLAMDTGWPPPVLLVTVSMPNGMRWPSFSTSGARQVDVALEGRDRRRLQALGITRSSASTPMYSRLPRVVSKWQLLGTRSPFLHTAVNSTFSAARPWCVGTKCMPVMSWITFSRRKKLRAPA
jgi:hypothetical protein